MSFPPPPHSRLRCRRGQVVVLIVAVILPTLAAVAAVATLRLYLTGGSVSEAEARALRRRVAALRKRLGMRQRDGFVLRCACSLFKL